MIDRVESVSRTLTCTPMTPHHTKFVHAPLGEELIAALADTLHLSVSAAYMVRNGREFEILHLYADKEGSDPRWHPFMNDDWLNGDAYTQIRDVLFAVMKRNGVRLPLEKWINEEGRIFTDCFHISLIDLCYWQTYWRTHSR